ncbi:proline-rich receptor-like protein kinase PERK5 [Carex rostrata]
MQCGIEDGNYEQLVDPKLQKNYKENEMARMIAVAAACVRHSAKRRPCMSMVVRALEGDTSLGGSYTSSEYESSTYNEDMKKFRKMAMQSGDYQSSQYSVPTSEYGLNPSGSSSEGQNLLFY